MTVVFCLGTRLLVHMCTTLENGVLHNRQQLGRAENSFIDHGELVAVKTLSGRKAPHCDKDQFCDKIPFVAEHCGLNNKERKKEDEKWHFCNHILLDLAVFRMAFGHL